MLLILSNQQHSRAAQQGVLGAAVCEFWSSWKSEAGLLTQLTASPAAAPAPRLTEPRVKVINWEIWWWGCSALLWWVAGALVGARCVSWALPSSCLQHISTSHQGCVPLIGLAQPKQSFSYDSSIPPTSGSNKPRIFGNNLIYIISPAHHLQQIFFFPLAWELGFVYFCLFILSQWRAGGTIRISSLATSPVTK